MWGHLVEKMLLMEPSMKDKASFSHLAWAFKTCCSSQERFPLFCGNSSGAVLLRRCFRKSEIRTVTQGPSHIDTPILPRGFSQALEGTGIRALNISISWSWSFFRCFRTWETDMSVAVGPE